MTSFLLRRGPIALASLLVLILASVHTTALAGRSISARSGSPDFVVLSVRPLPGGQTQPVQTPAPKPGAAGCAPSTRATADRPDIWEGPQVHVVYILASDSSDAHLDTNGTLDCSAKAQNSWMRAQSGGLEWRFDTFIGPDGSEILDVTFVRTAVPGAQLDGAADIERELAARGMNLSDKRYLSYVESDAGGTCGDAWYPLVQEEGVDGKFAQVYLGSAAGCHARDFGTPGAPSWSEAIAQQELMHNDAMTPIGAPHTCTIGTPPGLAHVCTPLALTEGSVNLDPERFDVMFPYVSTPLSEKKLDIGHDDYFRHSLPIHALQDSLYLRTAGSEQPAAVRPQPSQSPGTRPTADPSPTTEPSPDPSPSRSPSEAQERSISLATSKARLSGPGRARLAGSVVGPSDCIAGQSVRLEAKPRGTRGFRAINSTTSDQHGEFSFRPRVHRTTRFRVSTHATSECLSAVSPPVVIRVS